ncbi:MAG: immune inhibitor A [Anaerolineae bacterium]|nr:immune inhibitor A [Anaerolineae bacterium]
MNLQKLGGFALIVAMFAAGIFVLVQPASVGMETTARSRLVRSMAAPGAGALTQTEAADYSVAVSPIAVNLADVQSSDPAVMQERGMQRDYVNDYRLTYDEITALQAEAMSAPVNSNVQNADVQVDGAAPALLGGFDSIDFNEGGTGVPPDPEMAAGASHLIAVVNSSFEVYDKSGTSLSGVIFGDDLFANFSGCTSGFGTFDPNVVYDEEEDQYVQVWDGGGEYMCVAATTTGDPLGVWNLYEFPATPFAGQFFDYPHTGVGDNYIVVGSNQFGGAPGFEGRVWAMDKADLYAGNPVTMITASTTDLYGTPQPLHLHGFLQGTWPAWGDVHYFVTDIYDGCTSQVWRWDIGNAAPVIASSIDMCAATGVAGGLPVNTPQQGGSAIQANDWRNRMFEYRNDSGWITDSISCNPGGGTVNCARWGEIDLIPAAPSLVQAGVYASNGEYRIFPDLAVNECGDMAMGYTKSSTSMWPSIWFNGRESGDPLGTLGAEAELKAGEIVYTAFDSVPRRWGDYTGMTIDPDGQTFWYLGEYSKDIPGSARWGTYIGKFAYTACGGGGTDPIIVVNPGSLAATQPPDTTTMQDLDISNVGGADLDWSIYEDASVMRPVSAGREIATVGANGVAGLAAAGTGTGVRATPESQANRDLVTITHSATNNIVQFNSVSCNAGGLHTDNSYLRVFDLDSFGITDNFDVTEVEIGIEQALGATGSQPISVNLYTLTDPNAPLTFGNLTPIGSTDTTVSDQSLTLWTASVTGTAPAGSVLVVEIFTPDGQTTGNSFFIGSNPDGQTGPSYLAAAACGVPEPLPTGDLGFPGMHIVMNVTGDTTMGGGGQACDAPEDIGWASVAPDMGTTPPAGTDTVSVTFDSTGLADGTYEGALCVESNDPVTPLVEVPVSLTVETPVGADLVCNNDPIAFESGLPASWSVDTPFGTVYWSTTDDLAACDNGGNQTLGSGEAACADSDETNVPGDPYDTSLVTNAIDLTGYNSVSLDFAVNYNDIDASGGDMFSVEVSTDGGATWTSELSWNSDHNEITSVDLSSYGGNANVLVRFRYAGLGWDWWAQVDDVSLTCADAGVGPIIEVDPDTVHSSQQTNTTNDETFNINNLGDADLDWNIYEDAAFPAIPASDGNFPRGPYAASAGAPPAAANAPVSKGPGLNALLGSMAYGTETQTNNFDGFDLDVPEVLTPVAPYVWTTFPGAGAMDDGTDNVYFFDGQVAYEANVMTGVITPLGPVAGFAQDPSGMSQDPNTGVFYVVTTDVASSNLYTVDFGSLTATPVGTVTNAPAAIALAFTDAGDLYTYDIVNDVLLSVNPATGAGTVIGSIGFDANFGQGMDYDSASGTMYMAAFNSGTFQAELRSVNLGNGNTQFEGILGSAVPGGLTQLSFLAIEGGTPPPPEVCDVASDISWASVAPDMGTTPAMGSDTVTVTFDSTGLLPGEYEGTLCVESNDPNNPLVTVLLQLWVEEPPTAVEMADLSATVNADGSVTVAWETAAEVANAGFNVYRSVSADALGEMVNGALIASTASAGAGASYSFTDSAVGAGIFYYWVEAVATDGTTFAHGPVEAVTQAPTSAGLSGFGGGSSTALPLVLVAVLAVALLGGAFVSRRKA